MTIMPTVSKDDTRYPYWTFTTTDIVEWENDLTTGNYNLNFTRETSFGLSFSNKGGMEYGNNMGFLGFIRYGVRSWCVFGIG